MPEEPPDSKKYTFLSREKLQQVAQVTAYALKRKINGYPLNGELEHVRTFCTDIKNKFEQTPEGIRLRDTRSIDHIHGITNEFYGRTIEGNEFPQRVLEFMTGLENIVGMNTEEAIRYEKALSKFNQEGKGKP